MNECNSPLRERWETQWRSIVESVPLGAPLLSGGVLLARPGVSSEALGECHAAHKQAVNLLYYGTKKGIAQGYIPDGVELRIDSAVKSTVILLRDDDMTTVGGEPENHLAYDGSGAVQLLEGEEKSWLEQITGALLYRISGGRFMKCPNADVVWRQRVGFTDVDPGIRRYAWLTKIIGQHLLTSMLTDEFAILDPRYRYDGYMAYYPQRRLASALIDFSDGDIDLKAATRAFFEDDVASRERRTLLHGARAAYGSGALHKFDMLCRLADRLVAGSSEFEEEICALTRCIHFVQAGGNGIVRRTGKITLPGLPE